MTSSQFMDKQTMDLSSSQSKNDFIDLMNPQEDRKLGGTDKKEAILPSYDFQPIRPIGSSSPPSRFDSGVSGGSRAWNSSDNKCSSPSFRNYGSPDSFEPAKVVSNKDHQNAAEPTLLSEIDRIMKKYADNLLHALDGVSARLTQLESRSRHLENTVDDLKVSAGNNYGNSDGKMRQLENILREVQNGVQIIKDKQEIMDAQLQLAKLQVSNVQQPANTQSTEQVESSQAANPSAQQSHQQFPSGALVQSAPAFIPPSAPHPSNAAAPSPNMGQVPNHFSPNQIPSLPQREPYFPPPGQAPENPGQQFQVLPPQQQLQAPPPPQQYPPTQSQYSQQTAPPQQLVMSDVNPPQQYPPTQSQYSQQPAPPQQQLVMSDVNRPQPPPPMGHYSEEPPYMQSQSYPPSIRQQPPSPPPNAAAPPPQYYAPPPPNMYEPPPSGRAGPGFSGPGAYGPSPGSGAYGPSPGSGEPYPYGSNSSQYGSNSPVKAHQHSSHSAGGGGYPQLPTARPLPQALPTASGVGSGVSGSGNSGNKVPIEEVVEKVTHMGFPREQVRETVRKLVENGQAVDLNVVLDKLMNDGDGHSRVWFNR